MMIEGKEYIPGLSREPGAVERLRSHLYEGPFMGPGNPMCARGWNRDNGTAYSIWRNQTGVGICRTCLRRALAGLPSIDAKPDPDEEA
jgi:hypothetical protein